MATNVGVIILSKEQLRESTCHMRLDIEDNIGESMHVHYKNVRMDFSVVDFFNFAKACSDALQELHNPQITNKSFKPLKVYLRGSKEYTNIEPTNVKLLKSMNDISVNDSTPIKDYEIWNDKNLSFFVIPRHEPWIDDGILSDRNMCDNIIDYTQKDNKIIEVYNLNADEIVTKYYDGWYPFLIKSSNNWWNESIFKERQKAYRDRFSDEREALKFYNSVIKEYTNFTKNTGCYFSDVFPNNILVNEDYSDFRLIDIGCLKVGNKIDEPSYEQVITGGAANNIGFIR
tara:strand:+ start:1233 stop:2093 length:861 start_codon:yes stop_codon:yes gene_type:complete